MAIFKSTSDSQSPDSSLRLPAQKRIVTPAAQRLSTITEGANAGAGAGANTQPVKGILRSSLSSRPPSTAPQYSGYARNSQDTSRTGPPAYGSVLEPIRSDEDGHAPVEGEKLAQLRRGGQASRRRRNRGGWGRLALIIGLILLLAIGLGVGLGVGLTRRKANSHSNAEGVSSAQPPGTTPDTGQAQIFPLGEYSLITALRTVNTNCTSNAVTWRCYPYSIFNPSDSSTNTSSLATFNWVVTNTSDVYATNTTANTPDEGVPANLTISSTDNPFSISFTNQPMTYIFTSSNSTSARYTFHFPMHKPVIPATSITSNNAAAECFFNQTTFSASLYLHAASTFPGPELASKSGLGGYTPWPYAVEITQSSPGGQDVPACYETVNGAVAGRILSGLTPEPTGSMCTCDYRNY